jgi:hypothetical protein
VSLRDSYWCIIVLVLALTMLLISQSMASPVDRESPQPKRRSVSSGLADHDCPVLTNNGVMSITACSGDLVTGLQVKTTAENPPYYIELVRFDSPQENPYLGTTGIHFGELVPGDSVLTQAPVSFPANTSSADKKYYVYACLKPLPDDADCRPFSLTTVVIRSCGCLPSKCAPVRITKTKSGRPAR